MKQIYNFESAAPPRVTEVTLQEELERRTLRRQINILRLASILCCVCMALFAFFIFRDSVIVAVVSILMLTFTLMGNGIISLVFYRHGMCDHE